MLKFKKVLFSLLICLVLLTGSVFATTMSESEIKSYFNTNYSDDINVNANLYYNLTEIVEAVEGQAEMDEMIVSDNYIVFVYDSSGDSYFDYYDLGNNTIDSIVDSYGDPLINLTGNAVKYHGYCMSGDVSMIEATSSDSIYINLVDTYKGNTFDTIFVVSGNNVFTSPNSPTPEPDSNLQNIIASITAMITFIPLVLNALWLNTLIKFIILASLSVSIIYFVMKLLKSMTGNKLIKK